MLLLKGRKISLNALAFSPDGSRLAAAGERGYIQLWDLDGKKLDREIVTGDASNEAVFFVGTNLLVLHAGRVVLFSPATGKRLHQVPRGNRRFVDEIAMRPDGQRLAVAFQEQLDQYRLSDQVTDWRVDDGFNPTVTSLGYSANGKVLAAGMDYGVVMVFNANTGKQTNTLFPETLADVRAVALSPDGRSAAGCAANRLYLWRTSVEADEEDEEIARHTVGKTYFLAVSWHPSGDFFATANGDGKVDYWDATTGARRESFDWGVGKLNDVIFDATGDRAACCSKTGEIVIWDVDR